MFRAAMLASSGPMVGFVSVSSSRRFERIKLLWNLKLAAKTAQFIII
jgi:hypothetical protein